MLYIVARVNASHCGDPSVAIPLDYAICEPRVVAIGPNFQDIANTKVMTATALRVFLTTSHPKMPNLILTPEDTTDVIAYILSLREHR